MTAARMTDEERCVTLEAFCMAAGCEPREVEALMMELDGTSGVASAKWLGISEDAVYKFRSEVKRKLREHPFSESERSALAVAMMPPPERTDFSGLYWAFANRFVSSPRTPIFDRADIWAQEVGHPARAFAPSDLFDRTWRSAPRSLAEELARRNEGPCDWAPAPLGVK